MNKIPENVLDFEYGSSFTGNISIFAILPTVCYVWFWCLDISMQNYFEDFNDSAYGRQEYLGSIWAFMRMNLNGYTCPNRYHNVLGVSGYKMFIAPYIIHRFYLGKLIKISGQPWSRV